MNFRFHILDRNNVSTEVEEPVGFDALTCEISRDADWHGIFFTNSGETFEFYDAAYKLLKAEYELYAAQGDMTLIMEQECAGVWTEFDRGKFIFSKYEDFSDDCYIKCPLESVGEIMDLRNRVDQKVNLESLKAFDEITDLVAYDKLGFDLQLPSKGIFMQDKADMAIPETTNVALPTEYKFNSGSLAQTLGNFNYAWFQIVPQFEKQSLSEFGSFLTAASPEHEYIKSGWYEQRQDLDVEAVIQQTFPTQRWIYFDWAQATVLLNNDNFTNNFDAIKEFSLDVSYSFDMELIKANIIALYNVIVIRRADGTYEYLDKSVIFNGVPGGGLAGFNSGSIWLAGSTNTISFTASHPSVTLSNGDYLFVTVCGLSVFMNTDARDGLDAYNIVAKSGSVNMQTLTHFETTSSKVFAVNEVLSRISESITNDKLKAYSEYFGRTDSQPYATTEDGCGALEAITNGLRIRGQENKTPGQTDVFSQSLQDMFKGLCPIHNIGMGIEPDTNREGYNRLRIEPWNFFYNDTLVMSCTGINGLERKANDKDIYSIFQFGYDKWEAEEYNGLDELLTKRNYRTLLSQVKNTLAQISTFIASGYALEVTRRKGNDNTKDWRYDNDVFIICMKRVAGILAAELGNVTNPVNIVDPDTLYNFRISPVRNAMRWANKILASYRQFDANSKIIFTDGDGNYFAQGEMTDTNCRLEAAALTENQTIAISSFADSANAKPVLFPERVTYPYPFTAQDYVNIKANPGGKIYFESLNDSGYGWIDSIKWNPDDGTAQFSLIPKFTN